MGEDQPAARIGAEGDVVGVADATPGGIGRSGDRQESGEAVERQFPAQEGGDRIGAWPGAVDDDIGGEGCAVGQRHAGRAVAGRRDRRDRRMGAHRRPMLDRVREQLADQGGDIDPALIGRVPEFRYGAGSSASPGSSSAMARSVGRASRAIAPLALAGGVRAELRLSRRRDGPTEAADRVQPWRGDNSRPSALCSAIPAMLRS